MANHPTIIVWAPLYSGASALAAAKAGVTTANILKTANWSSESVFPRFYNKASNKVAYDRA